MSELFLEESQDVLDEWDAVRDDGNVSDAMRWQPDAPPRTAPPVPANVTVDVHGVYMVTFGPIIRAAADAAEAMQRFVISCRIGLDASAWIAAAVRRSRCPQRSKVWRRQARRGAVAVAGGSARYDLLTETYRLPDGTRVTAEQVLWGCRRRR